MSIIGMVKRLKPGVCESPRPKVSLAADFSSRLKSSAMRRLKELALRSQRSLPLQTRQKIMVIKAMHADLLRIRRQCCLPRPALCHACKGCMGLVFCVRN